MTLLDYGTWKKTAKVIIQMVAIAFVTCVSVLLVTSFCQQMVYNNTGLERNAFAEVFSYLIGW